MPDQPTDQTHLRDRIAKALAARFSPDGDTTRGMRVIDDSAEDLGPTRRVLPVEVADAVLAELPELTNRAAFLRHTATQLLATDPGPRPGHTDDYARGWADATHRAESWLRMQADQASTTGKQPEQDANPERTRR